jgi:hypothetical protein
LLQPGSAAVLLIKGSEGIWTKGSCVRNAKNQGKRGKNKKPNRLLVNAALKNGRARGKDPRRSRSENRLATESKKEEGRGKREEGRGKREEGRGKREEGRGKREEGRRRKEEVSERKKSWRQDSRYFFFR